MRRRGGLSAGTGDNLQTAWRSGTRRLQTTPGQRKSRLGTNTRLRGHMYGRTLHRQSSACEKNSNLALPHALRRLRPAPFTQCCAVRGLIGDTSDGCSFRKHLALLIKLFNIELGEWGYCAERSRASGVAAYCANTGTPQAA